jgi:hypothetical protein
VLFNVQMNISKTATCVWLSMFLYYAWLKDYGQHNRDKYLI